MIIVISTKIIKLIKMKSSLITIASVATLANAVSIIPYANHMAELQNKGTNKKAFVPEIRLATLKKLLA